MQIKISVPKKPASPVMPADLPPNAAIIWEKFPRIAEKISLMWGYPELQKYLSDIICDERGGRQGFPKPVLTVLMEIHRRHAKLVPEERQGHI